MNKKLLLTLAITILISSNAAKAIKSTVRTLEELTEAYSSAIPGDTIVIANGKFNWGEIKLSNRNSSPSSEWIVVRAETRSHVIFTGNTSIGFSGNRVLLDGFYFTDGNAGENPVISFRSSLTDYADFSRVTKMTIDNYNNPPEDYSLKNSWINLYGIHNRVDHNTLINKTNAKATLVVNYSPATFPEKSVSTYHRIDSNYFLGRSYHSNGGESMRIGEGNNSRTDGHNIIEYNLFENLAQDEPEIISNKSNYNTYRNNTFKNCNGGLTLRQGKSCKVYGNFFIVDDSTKTESYGIRITDRKHKVFNNYFEGLSNGPSRKDQGAIVIYYGTYSPSDSLIPFKAGYFPADSCTVAFNTIVNCYGGSGIVIGYTRSGTFQYQPAGLIISNNLIKMSSGQAVYLDPTKKPLEYFSEGNLYNAPDDLGISNNVGFTEISLPFQLRRNGILIPSVLIDEKSVNSTNYSNYIYTDIQGQKRSPEYDVGCDEFDSSSVVWNRPLDSTIVGAGK